jgi:hypothetical protein
MVNECEKRGLSIIEDSRLSQESVVEMLWHKVQKAERVFLAAEKNTQKENRACPAVADNADSIDLVDIPLPFSCPAKVRDKKHRHIIGFAATRLDDSRKKWQVTQIVMGCDGLLTS